MYNEFYRFREAPFNITPDPRFLFFSDRHREAFNHILFGIRERKGFIQITGEVGAGKTTVCRAILKELGPAYRTALILNPCMTSAQLLRAILTEFGLKPRRLDRVSSLQRLNEYLLEQATNGNDVVLFIDEATVRYHLSPLSREETEAYIQHRLRVAGADSRPVFTPWAVRKIFSYSRGVPRLINAVCDKTLLCGFVTGNDELTAAHVRRAIRELEGTFS